MRLGVFAPGFTMALFSLYVHVCCTLSRSLPFSMFLHDPYKTISSRIVETLRVAPGYDN